jgi:hypothetical protein
MRRRMVMLQAIHGWAASIVRSAFAKGAHIPVPFRLDDDDDDGFTESEQEDAS